MSILILGAAGNALDIADAILAKQTTPGSSAALIGFLDDDPALVGTGYRGYPVLGPLAALKDHSEACVVLAVGSSRNWWKRLDIVSRLALPPERYATVVDPRARVSPSATIGPGSVLLAGVCVAAQAAIGDHVMVLQNTVIGHDSRIGKGTLIAAGAIISGRVRVEDCCYVGAGAVVRDGIAVPSHSLVGMGAAVTQTFAESAQLVGVPARPKRSLHGADGS